MSSKRKKSTKSEGKFEMVQYHYSLIEINKNNIQNQHCLKNVTDSDGFPNRPSMGETIKHVVLPLIIELLLKKHTQFIKILSKFLQ